ncbi:MAG: ABC transporter permease [Bacteroidota bacterium]
MLRYISYKFVSGLSILFGVIILIFSLFILFPSADEISVGQRADEATKNAIRKEMGLDESKTSQFIIYLKDLSPINILAKDKINKAYGGVQIYMGSSVLILKWPYLRNSYQTRKPVNEILKDALIGSAVLALFAMGIALILGIGTGILSALKPGSLLDKSCLTIATLGISLPSFFVAVIIAWLFGFVWHQYTGLHMSGSLYKINPETGEHYMAFQNILLPSIALGIRPYAIIMQLTRSNLIDVMQQDYIRTARAKGLSEFQVIWKHALRNTLNPVLTAASGWFASLLAGAFFVEYVFNWKGLGKVTIDALQQSDLPVVMGAVLMIACIFIAVNVLVDILYAVLDPRVKLTA